MRPTERRGEMIEQLHWTSCRMTTRSARIIRRAPRQCESHSGPALAASDLPPSFGMTCDAVNINRDPSQTNELNLMQRMICAGRVV